MSDEPTVKPELTVLQAITLLRAATVNKHRAENAGSEGMADLYNDAGVAVRDELNRVLETGL